MLELLDLRERGERLEPTAFEIDPTVADTVRDILARVRTEGDDVLLELAERFDGARLDSLIVTDEELAAAELDTPAELKNALDALIERLHDLHARQLPREWTDERDGVTFGEIVRPLRAVGCYVPGGRAVYPSSVCMTVVPAVVAGVETRVLCTPPQADGSRPGRRPVRGPEGRAPRSSSRAAARRRWEPSRSAPAPSRASTGSSGPATRT